MKVGMRIVVTAVTDDNDDKSIAKTIDLGPDPATNYNALQVRCCDEYAHLLHYARACSSLIGIWFFDAS